MLGRVKYLPLLVFVFWWGFWLVIHNTSLSPIFVASLKTQLLFLLMIFVVSLAYILTNNYKSTIKLNIFSHQKHTEVKVTIVGRIVIYLLIILILSVLLPIGIKNGAFSTSPKQYFLYIRGADGIGSKLTDSSYIYILINFLIYPLLFSMWVIILLLPQSKFSSRVRLILFIIQLLFSYIYQVNYPIGGMIYTVLLVLFFFKRSTKGKLLSYVKKNIFLGVLIFGALMFYAATNRLGKFDFFSIIKRYLVTYNTVGIYFFDVKLNDVNSLLNCSPSFGRSFLGWFDSVADVTLRFFYRDIYIAANLENLNANMRPIITGQINGVLTQHNAFGTVLYTMYRDFNIVGILLYSFIYGIFLCYSYYKSSATFWRGVFIILIFAGIKSNGVSPIERPYFWFSILFIYTFNTLFIKKKSISGN